MNIILYFCGVKSILRYIAAAFCSDFCICKLYNRYSRRQEWVNGNVPKVSAVLNLTAPTVAFLFNVKTILL